MLETFKHLAEQEFSHVWIVDNLISVGGWTMLVGETKLGKSMLCIQLCEALQEGKPFLGMETAQRDCLYIQADAGLVEWHEQIKSLAPHSRAWTRHQMELGFIDVPSERKRLHEIVWGTYTPEVQGASYPSMMKTLKGKQFNFLVFDCLHALTQEDLNLKQTVLRVLTGIDEIVTRSWVDDQGNKRTERVPYLMVHHPNAQVKRGATAGAGNKAFSALCTTKLTLEGNNDAIPPTGILRLEGSKLAKKREIILQRAENGAWILPYEPDMSMFDTVSPSQFEDEIPF